MKMMLRIVFAVLFVATIEIQSVSSQNIWVSKDGNIRNVDTRALFISNNETYLATSSELYLLRRDSQRYEPVFDLVSGDNEITCLDGNGAGIFVGTKKGIYYSSDGGKTWTNIFRTFFPGKSNILCIYSIKETTGTVIIGTEKGVFISKDNGDRWEDISGNIKSKLIKFITADDRNIYACSEDGFYVKKSNEKNWERLYVKSVVERMPEEPDQEPAQSDMSEISNDAISCIAIKDEQLLIGCGKRILYSDDEGRSWRNFPSEGLSGQVNFILHSPAQGKLFCATSKGVFEYSKERTRWDELYNGMEKGIGVDKLVMDSGGEGSLWALTRKGCYKLESGRYFQDQYIDVEKNLKMFKIVCDGEPSYRQLQAAAVRFADVSPEKMERWKKEAKLKALMPKVSLGMDNNRSSNSEIYTSATKDYVVFGPDDINSGIDVSVSWELGDLIWSENRYIPTVGANKL